MTSDDYAAIKHIWLTIGVSALLATLAVLILIPTLTLGHQDLFADAAPGVLLVCFYIPGQFTIVAVLATVQLRKGSLGAPRVLRSYTKTIIITGFLYATSGALLFLTDLPFLSPLISLPVSCIATALLYAAIAHSVDPDRPPPS